MNQGGELLEKEQSESSAYVPPALQGVEPLFQIRRASAVVCDEKDDRAANTELQEGNASETSRLSEDIKFESKDRKTEIEREKLLSTVMALLSMTTEEEIAAVDLVSALRHCPEVIVTTASRLDNEVAE